jgi:hypothetical protein
MQLIFLLLWGCPPKTVSVNDEKRMQSGTYIKGVFRDKTFPLEGTVDEKTWIVEPQDRFGSRRFRAKHITEPIAVEIWRFQEVALQPAQYDFCSWSFLDRGYYSSAETKQMTSTCLPKEPTDSYVFAYIHHWIGSTWQFEIHAEPTHSISGKRLGEELLRKFIWHVDGGNPVLQP